MGTGDRDRSGWTDRTWRREPRTFWWLTFAVLGGGAVAFTVGVGVRDAAHRPGGASGWFYVWLVGSLLFCLFAYRVSVHPRLFGGSRGLVVRNVFRTYRLEWSDIAEIVVTHNARFLVHRRSAEPLVVHALRIARSENGAAWGRETRPQEVAEELQRLRPDLRVRIDYQPGKPANIGLIATWRRSH